MERDEEQQQEDHQTLIPQNNTFHMETHNSSPRHLINNNKKCCLISTMLIFLIILISVDIITKLPSNTLTGQMRESELKALFLLKQQQRAISSFLDKNRNLSNLSNTHLSSELLKQISLSREIEDVLFRPYGGGNFSGESYGIGGCGKVDRSGSERRTIEWKPRSDKFLLAVCVSGQMSNHLICLEKHMFFAALLNRVLVVPSSKVDYEYSRVVDVEHINKCVGRNVVVGFDEFVEKMNKGKGSVGIDRFVCYFSKPELCFMDAERVKKLKDLGISMGRLESPWEEDVKKPSKKTVKDVLDKFSSDDDVIAIGDVFFANVEQEWVMQPGGPLAHSCKTLIEPSRLILLTAQRFVQTFLGRDFVALHFRRHGFLKFCNAKQPSCFYPIPQAADCIGQVVERAQVPVVYLSTDAAESETGLLQSLVLVNGKVIPLVKRPAPNSAEKWDALLYRNNIENDSQVEAMLDKTICAMSSVFIGTSGSTFTEDILRLRKDWGTASLCDGYLCQGEDPNFIADNE